jgi:hypothetical protein
MNKDIIRMAQEAGWPEEAGVPDIGSMNLEHFAEIVRADEREACAKVCDNWPIGRDDVCEIAAAIRARSNK